MSERKYHCAICENEWSLAFIKKFEIARNKFINNKRKEFSFQCPICKAWLNGVVCPNCGKCVPPHIDCPICGSSLESFRAVCRQHL